MAYRNLLLRFCFFAAVLIAVAFAQTTTPVATTDTPVATTDTPVATTDTSVATTTPAASTTPPVTTKATTSPPTTGGTTVAPTTPPPTASGCILSNPVTTKKICPKFPNGIYYPLGLSLWDIPDPSPELLFPKIRAVACQACSTKLSTDYACSIMLTQYNNYCGAQNGNLSLSLKTACRYDCLVGQTQCTKNNNTFTGVRFWNCGETGAGNSLYATCDLQNPSKDSCCQSNRKADICHPPSWLAAKVAGAPRWVWIFVVGGALILLIAVAIFIYMHFYQREKLDQLFQPCKWCECCPKYYDL